jgi:putative RecB family exonuclease
MREAFRSIESVLGNVVHDVLEWLYNNRDQGRSPELGRTLEEFARRWSESLAEDVAVVRVADSADTSFRVGREMLERFHRTVFWRDRSATVALESRFSFRLSPRVVFTGFADRVGRTPRGRLFVVDYKTSRTEGNGSDFSDGLQAPLYAACALDQHGDAEALAGYHYLRPGTTRWLRVDQETARSVLQRFLVLSEEALRAAAFPANPGVLCAWCGFNHLCPAARVPDALAGGLALARARG